MNKNKTLDDLRNILIENLCNKIQGQEMLTVNDVELIKALLENEKY